MDYQQLIEGMSAEIYQSLVRSVELGRWPDGKAMSPEQRDNTMQAIIAWGERHLQERDRVGYVPKKNEPAEDCDPAAELPLSWKE
jgi:uncharacterized protein YeaC (DUF1315 family)